jgi:hypothetical protein
MEALEKAKNVTLFWKQTGVFLRKYELHSDDSIFAQLDFPSSFSVDANAVCGMDHWTFKRKGTLSKDVIVSRVGMEGSIASYKPRWTGSEGTIQITNGEEYIWRVANFWATRHSVSNKDGHVLVSYQSSSEDKKLSNIFKLEAQVRIFGSAWELRDLPLLVVLGWYLTILQHEDSAAAATTASVAVLN